MGQAADMHVLFVIKGLRVGGAERWVLLATKWLRAHGVSVSIANLDPDLTHLEPQLIEAGAQVEGFDVFSWRVISETRRLVRFIEDIRADLIHAHLPMSGVIARCVGRYLRLPVVYTEHSVVDRYSLPTRWLNRLTYGMDSRKIAVSSAIANAIFEEYGNVWRGRVDLIQNPIDVAEVGAGVQKAESLRAELGIPSNHVLIGSVASFRPVKRLDLLLTVFTKIAVDHPNASLLLVGTGPEMDRLVELTKILGIEKSVHFTGFRPDPARYTAALDIFVLCSEWEGLPIAVLEAMATGRAVVATAVGGVPEVIRDGHTGLLVQSGNAEQLMMSIVSLIENPLKRATLGWNAAEAVRAEHDPDQIMRRYYDLYCGLS